MHDHVIYPVEIILGGQTKQYSTEFQTDPQYADSWKKVLTMAHAKATVRCLCPGEGEKRLSIHSRSYADHFHLARFPETGTEHSEDCAYYGADPNASGMGSYRRGVIQELDDGNTKIKLKVGLQQRPTQVPTDTNAATGTPKTTARRSTSQTSMSLLGLLHYLWTQASLNTWTPGMQGKRNLGVIHHHLMRVASTTYAGRVKLAQNLLIGTPSSEGTQSRLNQAKSLSAVNDRRRLIVIAPLARYREGMESAASLPVAGFHGIPHLVLPPQHLEIIQQKFPRELSGWVAGNPVMLIAQTNPPQTARSGLVAEIIDLGLMWITREWIPVDSGFEALIAEKLASENRRFEKPLRFDSEMAVFPDFVLKDCEQPSMPLEVWGMSTSRYLDRKQEKAAYYDQTYGPGNWWSWNGAAGDPIPDFPAPAGRTD